MTASTAAPDRFFPNTSWTLLGEARGTSPQAANAREEFARRYYQPVLAYFAALTHDRGEAEELTQGFFEKIAAAGDVVAGADSSRGHFRHYLKRSISNYWKDDLRSRNREKRKPEEEVRPDAWSGAGWERLEIETADSPEAAFHQAWVRRLLDDALYRVRDLCKQKKQTVHYELFLRMYLSDGRCTPSWRELGAAFSLDEKAARSKTETVARHFRLVLREMVGEMVGADKSAGDKAIDEEIAALLGLL